MKKVFSILMVLILCLAMLPMGVMAAGTGIRLGFMGWDNVSPGENLGAGGNGTHPVTVWLDGVQQTNYTAVSGDTGVCTVTVDSDGTLYVQNIAPGTSVLTITVGSQSESFNWYIGEDSESEDEGESASTISFGWANEYFGPEAGIGDYVGGPYSVTVWQDGAQVTEFTAKSADTNICTVAASNGVLEITAVAPGDTTVTVTVGKESASFNWHSEDPNAVQPDMGQDSGISLMWNNEDFGPGSSFGTGEAGPHTLEVRMDGAQVPGSDYTVTSEDEEICTVETAEDGCLLITCTGNGESIITVTVGDKSAKFTWCVDGFGLNDEQQPEEGEQQPDMGQDSGISLSWGNTVVEPGATMSSDSTEPNVMTVWLNGERVTNFTVESSDMSVCDVCKGAGDTIEVRNGGKYGWATITVTVGDKTACFEWLREVPAKPEDAQGINLYWDGGVITREENIGAPAGIYVMTVYDNGVCISDYTAESSDTTVCKVSKTGDGLLVVEALKPGSAVIDIAVGNKGSVFYWETVDEPIQEPEQPEDVSGVTLTDGLIIAPDGSGFGLLPGGYMTLFVCLDQERVSDFTVTVADESILKAHASGSLLILEGVSYGYTTFTITAGGKSAAYNWCTSDGDQPVHDCSYYIIFQEGWEPTCMDIGAKDFYFCAECGVFYGDAEGKEKLEEEDIILEPVDHKWHGVQTEDPDRVLFECVFGCGETYEAEFDYHSKLEIGEVIVSEGLKDKGYETPEEIKEELTRTLVNNNNGHTRENTQVHEVTLMVSLDSGKTWQKATAENFPEEGLEVLLPYPEGVDPDKHDFVVAHMFASDMNGHKAGDIEYPQVEKTEDGIRFTVNGLSPIAVSWKEDVEVTPAPTEPIETPKSSAPKTGDNNPVILFAGMLIVCAVGAAVVIRKGKKKA